MFNNEKEQELQGEESIPDRQEYVSKKLDEKYNLKFLLVCQLFESLVKAKTKSKVK